MNWSIIFHDNRLYPLRERLIHQGFKRSKKYLISVNKRRDLLTFFKLEKKSRSHFALLERPPKHHTSCVSFPFIYTVFMIFFPFFTSNKYPTRPFLTNFD